MESFESEMQQPSNKAASIKASMDRARDNGAETPSSSPPPRTRRGRQAGSRVVDGRVIPPEPEPQSMSLGSNHLKFFVQVQFNLLIQTLNRHCEISEQEIESCSEALASFLNAHAPDWLKENPEVTMMFLTFIPVYSKILMAPPKIISQEPEETPVDEEEQRNQRRSNLRDRTKGFKPDPGQKYSG